MWGEKNDHKSLDTDDSSNLNSNDTNPDIFNTNGKIDINNTNDCYSSISDNVSTIGKSICFDGVIKSQEDILILGKVKGEIISKNNKIIVGPSGTIHANLVASNVKIEGKLVGDVYAHQVAVLKEGSCEGNINSPRINIEDGAKFKGSIDMGVKSIEEKLGNKKEQSTSTFDRIPKVISPMSVEGAEDSRTN